MALRPSVFDNWRAAYPRIASTAARHAGGGFVDGAGCGAWGLGPCLTDNLEGLPFSHFAEAIVQEQNAARWRHVVPCLRIDACVRFFTRNTADCDVDLSGRCRFWFQHQLMVLNSDNVTGHCLVPYLSVLDNLHKARHDLLDKSFCRNLFSITVL
jgi:hypothetical protein